jgi:cell division protein FtsB
MIRLARELFRAAAQPGNRMAWSGWAAGLTLAAAYAWMAFWGPQGIQSLLQKHHEISRLEEQNADKARQNEALRERIRRLEDSGSEQELEIRKELKLLRPGETTFLLPDPPKGPETPQQ